MRGDGQMTLHDAICYEVACLPEDFPGRLNTLKEVSGLSWNQFADTIGVDLRQVQRWRKGVEPKGGAMLALIRYSRRIPGGLDVALDGMEVFVVRRPRPSHERQAA